MPDVTVTISGKDDASAIFQKVAAAAKEFEAQAGASASATNEVTTAIEKLGAKAEESRGILGTLGQAIGQVALYGGAYQALGASVQFVDGAIVGLNNQLETSKIAFTALLGSSTAADDMLVKLKTLADQTPFEFQDVLTGSQRFLQMGLTAQQVIPALTAVGDAAAQMGAGAEGVDRISLALMQMHNHGVVSAQDMLQITSVGVDGWKILADAMGITTQQAEKFASQGLIPADQAIQELLAGMEKSAPNAMAAMSQTFMGLASTMHDQLQGLAADAGKPIFTALEAGIKAMAADLSDPTIKTNLEAFGAGLASLATTVAPALLHALGDIGDTLSTWGNILAGAASDISGLSGALGTATGQGDNAHAVLGTVADDVIKMAPYWVAYKVAVEAAAIAQGLFNAAATPIGPIIAALTPAIEGLTVGIGLLRDGEAAATVAALLFDAALVANPVGIAIAGALALGVGLGELVKHLLGAQVAYADTTTATNAFTVATGNATAALTAFDTEATKGQAALSGGAWSDLTASVDKYTGAVQAASAATVAAQNAADHDTASQVATAPITPTADATAANKAYLDAQQAAYTDALDHAKTYYADQAQTAKDAADATKTTALADAQATLDGTKAEVAQEKQTYDDRAQADIAARQAQTTSALSELQKQNTAAQASAAAAHTADLAQQASIQHTADESDTAWKAQVTAIKDAATAGEDALHASNDNILTDAKARDQATYASQQATIAGLIHSREEADARDIHSHELATAANIANLDKEKTATLAAIDQETQAYAAQEAERVTQIDATASAQVKALNDTLAAEKQANTDRLAVNSMTTAHGAAAGQELGQFLTASEAVQADTQAALDAKAAGNQELADQDTAAAARQQATAQTLSDTLSQIDQATADQMVAYRLQQDTATTAAQVAAIQQQATNQKTALADQLATEKQSQADRKTAATAYYDGLKADQQKDLDDYKWNVGQQQQAFKDAEAAELASDKTTLDTLLANIATQQDAENTRHADAIAKINAKAAADTAAIDKLTQQRHDAYTAWQVASNAAYTAEGVRRAADYKESTDTINAQSDLDIGKIKAAQTAADTAFAARTLAADNHFKQQQLDITNAYNADVTAIQNAQTANAKALTQMGKDTKAYVDGANQDLQSVITSVSNLTGAMGATANFHAPGKGPLSPPQVFTAGDFSNAGQAAISAYTGVYGDQAAAKWAADATANAAAGKGASDIGDLLNSNDVLSKSALFLQGAAEYAYGTGANTLCERFTANMEGRAVMDTAAVAGEHRAAAGQLQHSFPPPAGAEVYFGPNAGNEWEGHDGISLGNGMFRSVTSSGIRDASIASWADSVAPLLGWVPQGTPMYAQGGIVPGAIGAPQLVIAHGGEEYLGVSGQRGTLADRGGDRFDYRRLAEEFVTALERRPPTIAVDGRALGNAMRTDQRRFRASGPANGVGGLP